MKKLPLTTALPVLFWGWQTEMLIISACIVPFLEAAAFVKRKWAFSDQDFSKISDLCSLILAGLLVYYLINDPLKIIIKTVTYLPLIILPIMLAQLYSVSGQINIRSLMLFSGKERAGGTKTIRIDFAYVYAAVCLISAGMGNSRDNLFYLAVICLSLWILFPLRSKRYSPFLWLALFIAAAVSGYVTHTQISRLQEIVTSYTINYLASKSPDPRYQVTSMGEIGTLKLSNKIVSRLEKKSREPIYLQLSAYTAYSNKKWFATLGGFSQLKAGKEKDEWTVHQEPVEKTKQLTLYTTINENKLLALPAGTTAIKNLAVERLEKNSLGAVRAHHGKGFTACSVSFDDRNSYIREPGIQDTVVPPDQKKIFSNYIKALNNKNRIKLEDLTTAEKLNWIKNHFKRNYSYSLTQKESLSSQNPIENFLKNTRAGHCEFFATTSIMLLRELKIPARYVTGYLVHEYDASKNLFIVRERDAHAWCIVYVNGHWITIDTTPSNWIDYEKEKTAETPVKDFISDCRFYISKWFAEHTKEELLRFTLLMLLPFGLYLLFRLKPSGKISRVNLSKPAQKKEKPSKNQGLYLIEEKLNNKGYHRYKWETFGLWFERIGKSGLLKDSSMDIQRLLSLHYQQRYGKHHEKKNRDIEKTDSVIGQIEKIT